MEENNNQQPQYQQYQQYQVPQGQYQPYQQPQYQVPQPNYQPQYQPQYNQPASTASIFALILGIASIAIPVVTFVTQIFFSYSGVGVTKIVSAAFWGLVSGIIATVLGATEKKKTNNKLAKAGLICGIIGLGLVPAAIIFVVMLGFAFSASFVF